MNKTLNQTGIAKAVKSATLSTATTVLLTSAGMLAAPAQAGELEEMKQDVQQLIKRIDQMESKQTSDTQEQTYSNKQVFKPKPVVRNRNHQEYTPRGADPISFKLGASDTEVTVSGYIKLDAIYDLDQDVGDSFIFSSIAADGTAAAERDPHVRLHARQSRLRVRTSTPVGNEEIKTLWEGDFYGGGGNQSFSNSTSFRIRHAWITYGGWGFGQYWSNFMENNFVAYPTTVDFFGPVGQSFVRSPQIRYTANNGFSVSIENPETDGFGSLGRLRESTGGVGSDQLPDLTLAWRGGPGGSGGSYEFATVFRTLSIQADTDGDGDIDVDEDENGLGFMAAGGWQLGDAYLYAHLNFGDGLGRFDINGFGNGLFVDAAGNVDTVESMGLNFGVTFDVGDNDKLNFTYGLFENDDPDESNGIDELTSFHAGYINNIGASGLALGVEVIVGEIENADGSDGDATRLQFMAQKSF